MSSLKFGRFDYATCMTFAAYAICSMAIPMCLVPLATDLRFPLEAGGMGLGGALQLGRSIPMVAAMVLCGFAAGRWGKRRSLGFSVMLMTIGIMVAAFSPGYIVLFMALAFAGLGEGVIEGLTTPFVQDLHPDQPGRYLNISHSFWSVGVVVLVLAAGALLGLGVSWRIILFASGLIAAIPTVLYLWPTRETKRIAKEEKVQWRGIIAQSSEIVRQPRFWLFFTAMFFAGGGEFCLTFWCASFIQIEFGGSPMLAGLGTACFAAGMFTSRLWSGIAIQQHNLKKLVIACSVIAVVITLMFPWIQSKWLLFVLLFPAGMAAGPFWPSIQSDGALRLKGDYTMAMILFSCAGVPGCGFFSMFIGVLGDWFGLRMSFLVVPACFALVFVLMYYDYLTQRRENATRRPSQSSRTLTIP